jgi:hypothetical protein
MHALTLLLLLLSPPIFGAMNHGGMIMDKTGMIMNHNPNILPKDCPKISKDVDITIHAGRQYSKDFPGKMFTYDKRDWQVPGCARINVTFINDDDIRHQFMIHGLPGYMYPKGMFTIEIYGKGKKTASFIVPSRDYTYYIHCEVSQHTEKGMKAQLKVGKGSGDLNSILGLTAALTPDNYPINNTQITWLSMLISFLVGIVFILYLGNFLRVKLKK